jgi:uncharacterized protein YbaA (DUF1428 family)
MQYVDGFVVPVKRKQLRAYARIARQMGRLWRKHGALEYRECVADDVKRGKVTSFPRSVKLQRDEIVVFSYIVYRSRADRDRVNAKAMNAPIMKKMMKRPMPFDLRRMFFGGFETLVKM